MNENDNVQIGNSTISKGKMLLLALTDLIGL